MTVTGVIAQLRTTNLEGSIAFWTGRVGLRLAFRYADFYAGIAAGGQVFHLKLADEADPSIPWVRAGEHFHLYLTTDDAAAMAETVRRNGIVPVSALHETPWGTREFVFHDDQGHTIHVGEFR